MRLLRSSIGKLPAARRSSLWSSLVAVLPSLLVGMVFAVVVYYLRLGIEFGWHWDEPKMLASVRRAAETGIILPGWYNYPSLTFLLTLCAAGLHFVGDLLSFLRVNGFHAEAVAEWMASNRIGRQDAGYLDILHSIRTLFALLTILSAPLIYVACRVLRHPPMIALLAFLIVILSDQILYHARWIAPDTIQVVLMSALVLFVALFAAGRRARDLAAVTIVVGLMIATKYPAGIFVLTPLVLINADGISWRRSLHVLVVVAAVFLIVTPGAFVQPLQFLRDVSYEMRHYRLYGHHFHTVEPGLAHLRRILEFVVLDLFAASAPWSVALAALAALGMAVTARRQPLFFFAIVLPMLLYLVYFASQRVMIVRNLLLVLPPLALLAAVGLVFLVELQPRVGRVAVGLVVLVSLAIGLGQLHASTMSVHRPTDWHADLARFLETIDDRTVGFSAAAVRLFEQVGLPGEGVRFVPREVRVLASLDKLVFVTEERLHQCYDVARADEFPHRFANHRGAYSVVAGTDEVDIDRYPDWSGRNRVVATNDDLALPMARLAFSTIYVLTPTTDARTGSVSTTHEAVAVSP